MYWFRKLNQYPNMRVNFIKLHHVRVIECTRRRHFPLLGSNKHKKEKKKKKIVVNPYKKRIVVNLAQTLIEVVIVSIGTSKVERLLAIVWLAEEVVHVVLK